MSFALQKKIRAFSELVESRGIYVGQLLDAYGPGDVAEACYALLESRNAEDFRAAFEFLIFVLTETAFIPGDSDLKLASRLTTERRFERFLEREAETGVYYRLEAISAHSRSLAEIIDREASDQFYARAVERHPILIKHRFEEEIQREQGVFPRGHYQELAFSNPEVGFLTRYAIVTSPYVDPLDAQTLLADLLPAAPSVYAEGLSALLEDYRERNASTEWFEEDSEAESLGGFELNKIEETLLNALERSEREYVSGRAPRFAELIQIP